MGDLATPSALFVADGHFHLRPDPPEQRRLRRFLELVGHARAADHLVLLGDIFDFWFDYPHFRLKGYEEILAELDAVRAAGTRIHFVGGNHDIWAAGYLHDRYGTGNPSGGPQTLSLGEARIRLDHGDGLLARSAAYTAFRRLVRNRAGILFAKSWHPELLYAFSTWLSGTSRQASRDEVEVLRQRALALVRSWRDSQWDLLVIGHVHHPMLIEGDHGSLAVLGSWLDAEGYGLFHGGRLELRDFRDGAPVELLRPAARPREPRPDGELPD
jgi:UDP-2,3-diacylglucosamine hydrolase